MAPLGSPFEMDCMLVCPHIKQRSDGVICRIMNNRLLTAVNTFMTKKIVRVI